MLLWQQEHAGHNMYTKHKNLKFSTSLCQRRWNFDSPFFKRYLSHQDESIWVAVSLSALTFCLCTFFSCRPLGTAWWENPTWSKCLILGCQGNATMAAHALCRAVMREGQLLSVLPCFPFPGLSLMISIPAPQGPSSQSSGLLQRFSPTATIAPNLMFGHLVRTSCQNGKKLTNTMSENHGAQSSSKLS